MTDTVCPINGSRLAGLWTTMSCSSPGFCYFCACRCEGLAAPHHGVRIVLERPPETFIWRGHRTHRDGDYCVFETTDEQHGKRLLIPSAYYLNAAYRMYGLPARVYSDQSSGGGSGERKRL